MSEQRYLVTARKYRPQLFGELVAQEHVTETLKNAIKLDRLAHSYLFSGQRGVGKTTAARILAKAINCTADGQQKTELAEPCRQCDSCRSFEEGRNLNIYEIDAASNNKVEDVRELRETVRIPPQGNRKKVYIIDEVHMLSNAAFNALLKTLEEPPPHVLFIFATTEPHKVLPTILSRCQRFDFRRIPVPDTINLLQDICTKENIEADDASLLLMARKGDGALRDALSVFDQAVSLCGTRLVYDDLAQALGVVDIDLFFEVTKYIADNSSAGMLNLVERIVQAGFDLQEFLVGLAEHLRNLLVALTMKETSLIEVPEGMRERYKKDCDQFSESDLLRLLMIVSEAEEAIKSSTYPRLKLEIALVKMSALTRSADLRSALSKLDRVEAYIRGQEPSVPITRSRDAVAVSRRSSSPSSSTDKPTTGGTEARSPLTQDTIGETEQPIPSPTSLPTEPEEEVVQEEEKAVSEEQPAQARQDEGKEKDPAPESPPEKDPESATTPEVVQPTLDLPNLFGQPALKKKVESTKANKVTAPSETVTDKSDPDIPVATAGTEDVDTRTIRHIDKVWQQYVQSVKEERIHVGTLLEHAVPVLCSSDNLIVAVPDEFHQRLLKNQHDFLLEKLSALIDEKVYAIQYEIKKEAITKRVTDTPIDFDPYAYMQKKRKENPVIRAIFDQFGGELVW